MIKVFLLSSLLILAGCTSLKPLKPGQAHGNIGADRFVLNQSENPSTPSTQGITYDIERGLTIPKDSIVTSTDISDGRTNILDIKLSANTDFKIKETKKVDTTVGAAQKDVSREVAAKLKSLSSLVYIGVVLMIFGAASLFYPPLRLLIGSTTTSLACAGLGLVFIMLPSLVVGNEVLILCVGLGALIIYFFAHRYGANSREVQVLREFVDENEDEIDDHTGLKKEEFNKKYRHKTKILKNRIKKLNS